MVTTVDNIAGTAFGANKAQKSGQALDQTVVDHMHHLESRPKMDLLSGVTKSGMEDNMRGSTPLKLSTEKMEQHRPDLPPSVLWMGTDTVCPLTFALCRLEGLGEALCRFTFAVSRLTFALQWLNAYHNTLFPRLCQQNFMPHRSYPVFA